MYHCSDCKYNNQAFFYIGENKGFKYTYEGFVCTSPKCLELLRKVLFANGDRKKIRKFGLGKREIKEGCPIGIACIHCWNEFHADKL